MLRTPLTATALIAFISTGCLSEPEPNTTNASIASATTVTELSALGKDPEFRAVLEKVSAVSKTATARINGATPEQRERLRERIAVFRADLVNLDPDAPLEVPEVVTNLTGLDKYELVELRADVQRLVERHPSVAGYPAQLGQAANTQAFFSMEYELHAIEECDSEECQCVEECDEEYQSAINDAGFDWVGDLWSLNPWTIITGSVDYVEELDDAYDALLACYERCTGVSLEECQDDWDCDSDEFCSKPVGNPYNRCRDKKANGKVCSRDGKCASGCCDYNFFEHPLSQVCRPARFCN